MMRVRVWLVILFFLRALVGASVGSAQSEAGDVAREDLQDVLSAFADAGQESYLPAEGSSGLTEKRPWLAGRISFWNRLQQGENSWQARARILSGGFLLRAKVRPGVADASTGALATGWEGAGWGLWAGGLGLTSGFGLLLSDPGRRAGLEAGSSFASPGVRLRGWSSAPQERSVFGAGVQVSRGLWRLTAVQGAPGQDRPGTGFAALVLERQGEMLSWALAGVEKKGGPRGVSLSGTGGAPGRRLAWEMCGRQDSPGSPWALAWLFSGRWDPGWRMRAEIQVAGSTSEEGPSTGQRPAVLQTWGGRGWAARWKGMLNSKTSVALLLAHSRGSHLESQARRHARQTAEIHLRYRPEPGWSLTLRARDRRDRKWSWSQDHPWLPARLEDESPQRSLLARIERRAPLHWWRLAWRRLRQGEGREMAARSLLEFKGGHQLGQGLEARLHQMWAWGQEVDLVTAITPVPGMVRARHWGRWAAETVLSLVQEGGAWVLATGLSRRLTGDPEQGADEYSIWLHGSVFW